MSAFKTTGSSAAQLVHRIIGCVQRSIVYAHRRKVSNQSGFALLVVILSMAILGAIVSEFGYNARIEYESAANARDQLRAEYLARSGINLSRMMIKVQERVIDQLNSRLGSDFQITLFAPMLLSSFGGSDEEKADVGAALGGGGALKGISLGKGGTFDVELGVEDGKLNVNCGGGTLQLAPAPPPIPGVGGAPGGKALTNPQGLYNMLTAVLYPIRYNRLFETATPDGQFVTRDEVARAIIDWSDFDDVKYEPFAPGNGSEDYRYDGLRDPYKPHNNYFDTVEELNLVRGVTPDFYGSFADMFTVYGRCQVNLRAIKSEHWPITAAVVRASANNPQDPLLYDDTMISALSQQLITLFQLPGMYTKTTQVCNGFKNGFADAPPVLMMGGLRGITVNCNTLNMIASIGPRQVYKIVSTGSVKRGNGDRKIQVRITAIWDNEQINLNTVSQDINDRKGTWKYWRME